MMIGYRESPVSQGNSLHLLLSSSDIRLNEIEDFLFSLQIEDLLKESFISLHFIHSEDKLCLSLH